ncbi:competence protein CoiA family protein [Neobacillus sp. FSL H8-0543]|uniref:competence protein CoiA family protein n=1 Tax=Neobacillus sp. FSL H8-0543 TaxID=2954672 RepID=UPI003158D8FA
MQEALYEGKYFHLRTHLDSMNNEKSELDKLKKRADKGAYHCPYCGGDLIIKSGEIREEHFSHRHSKSCEVSVASEVYQKQINRESKKHSSIKEIIYDELKTQEKLNNDLQVEYGYVEKAKENWRYYPDIVMKNKDKEIAITILTNVNANKDEKLVKQIKNRNRYFNKKSMETIWFVEDAELSIDLNNNVIHLWEAELDIALKTNEDLIWEAAINDLALNYSIYELFNYYHRSLPKSYDIKSLYYVHTSETHIVFTVHRFIIDELKYPFRAFALNNGYQISLSKALLAQQESLQLSDHHIENENREKFINLVIEKQLEKIKEEQELNKYTSESLEKVAEELFAQSRIVESESPPLGTYMLKKSYGECTSYEELLNRHLEELKKIRNMEDKIPVGLKKDWDFIQETVGFAKNRTSFDYSRFKLLLENLKNSLRIK